MEYKGFQLDDEAVEKYLRRYGGKWDDRNFEFDFVRIVCDNLGVKNLEEGIKTFGREEMQAQLNDDLKYEVSLWEYPEEVDIEGFPVYKDIIESILEEPLTEKNKEFASTIVKSAATYAYGFDNVEDLNKFHAEDVYKRDNKEHVRTVLNDALERLNETLKRNGRHLKNEFKY